MMGQVLDQISKIDSTVGGKVKDDFRGVEKILSPHQFHVHIAGLNALSTKLKGGLFLSLRLLGHINVIGRGQAQYAL